LEAQLKESEQRYRSLFENSGTATVIIEEDTTISMANAEFEKLSGYSKEEIEGKKSWTEFVYKKDLERMKKYHIKRREDEESIPRKYEFSFVDKNGNIKEIFLTAGIISGTKKSIASLMDITHIKLIEKELKESEARTRAILNAIPDLIFQISKEGRFISYKGNKKVLYTKENFLGKKVFEVLPLEIASLAMQYIEKALRSGKVQTFEYQLPIKGELHDYESRMVAINKDEVIAIIRDITFSKKTEKALKESEERFRTLVEDAPFGISILRADRSFEYLNPKFTEIFGYTINDIPNKDIWFKKAYPNEKYRKKVLSVWKEDFFDNLKVGEIKPRVFTVRCKDEKDKIIHFRGVLLKDGKQLLTYQDITAQKKAEEALRESEERFRAIFETAKDCIFIKDKNLRFVLVNPFMEQLFGISLAEFRKKKEEELFGEKVAKHVKDVDIRVLNGKIIEEEYTKTIQGVPKVLHIIKVPMRDKSGEITGLCGIARDVTKLKRLESQLLQAQKMEAIGTLAGGIAHDFNNLLMGIQGNASLMLLNIDPSHPHYERLKNIEKYVQSGSELTKQLLGFATGGKYEVKPININALIDKSSELFGRTKKEIKIYKKFQQDIWRVEVDEGQIHQVLLNLYVNAWQSMPGGGELYLQTEKVTLDEKYAEAYHVEPGKYVKISVTDTGVGMDETTRQRIFEPFFTTKKMGRGTGLGLASAYGIIKNHGGIINVYSEPGKGASFNIYLPASQKDIVKEKKFKEKFLKGSGTILLIDDEEMIIEIGEEFLKILGYKVLVAKNGEEAIEIYKKNKDKIDMVILDMIMPVISGSETYDRLKNINPNIKVLLSSGYSINGQANEILKKGCSGFIQKPFTLEKLSQSINKILNN
ncbi:MAG: hypothetical protein DRG20_01880, partial [Deltaproteobacteria bacterium]